MATKSVVQLERNRAVKLLMFCGWHQAEQAPNDKLASMLAKLDKVYEDGKDPEPEDDEMRGDLKLVMHGIKENDDFEVVDGDGSEAAEKTEQTEQAEKSESQTERKTREKPTPSASANRPEGVRVSRTISHITGEIFRKHGFEQGVTDEMAVEFLQETGKDDVDVARANLAWAWHVLNGFTKKFEVN